MTCCRTDMPFSTRTYLLRSLRFHRRAHRWVAAGAALAATVLIGALMVGDSVRHTLLRLALSRLGASDFIVVDPERFFTAGLADRVQEGRADRVAAVLLLEGVVLSPEGDRRVNGVQVVGVEDRFWDLAPQPTPPPELEAGACRINPALAERLGGADAGAALVLRLRKPGGMPADLAPAPRDSDAWTRRLRVAGVQAPEAFGQFTLRTTQSPPPTVFLPRAWLGAQLGIAGRANVLLVQAGDRAASPDAVQSRLDACWRLEDADLSLEPLPEGGIELRSGRVFIAPPVAEALLRTFPDAQPIVTYFVNRIASGGRSTPYSFVSAAGPPRVPAGLADDEALVNDWLAEDLGLTNGSPLTLTFDAVGIGGRLQERTAALTVAGIVPLSETSPQDRRLAPVIPGLSDIANCRDWDPGLPIDLARIRPRDEDYWNAEGPLPKLYLATAAAERLFGSRFGVYTGMRIPGAAGTPAQVEETLRRALRSRDLGWTVQAARSAGLEAGREGVAFGPLFTGLSFFLIVAALLLTVLLFAFQMQRREDEIGTLRALGFRPRQVVVLLTAEGLAVAAAGVALGCCLAPGYNVLILRALETVWQGAVRTASFEMRLRPLSLLTGAVAVWLAAVAGMVWVLRGQVRATIRALQRRQPEADGGGGRAARRVLAAGVLALLAALGIAAAVPAGQGEAVVAAFFVAGCLVLAGLLAAGAGGLGLAQEAAARRAPGIVQMALRGAALRRGRSLACAGMVALGVFLVVAVGANRRGDLEEPHARTSGTGGYALWGETTLPLLADLNQAEGRARLGVSDEAAAGVTFTPLRRREGDDASCLNLNRVAQPHLLGVDPAALDRRGAFTFARLAEGADPQHPWRVLERDLGPDTVPAVADQAVIVWSLGKSLGDTLQFTDEAGRPFRLQLVGGLAPSIFQGHLLVSEAALLRRFPSLGGSRVLLVDVPPERTGGLARELTRRLADLGFACEPAAGRLAAFRGVENTYLAIFLLLGALGVLLGCAGLGIVAARNLQERRAEFALLRAVGFRRRHLRRLLFSEHVLLAVTGILAGAAAAAVAVTPALLGPEADVPWRGLLLALGAVLAGSLLWIALAVRAALRGPLLPALRNE